MTQKSISNLLLSVFIKPLCMIGCQFLKIIIPQPLWVHRVFLPATTEGIITFLVTSTYSTSARQSGNDIKSRTSLGDLGYCRVNVPGCLVHFSPAIAALKGQQEQSPVLSPAEGHAQRGNLAPAWSSPDCLREKKPRVRILASRAKPSSGWGQSAVPIFHF